MSDGDDFLSRWSRRKRAVAAAERAEELKPPVAAALPAPPPETSEAAPPPAARATEAPAPAAPESDFDIASLPPIESIGAGTDISGFLKPGVPSALRHAALRRAWSTDPVIRSFKGLAENDWDFTSPDTPGFGPLDPGFDVEKMVAQLFGETPPSGVETRPKPQAADQAQAVRSTAESDAVTAVPESTETTLGESPLEAPAIVDRDIVQRDADVATQQDQLNCRSSQPSSRRHGSAVPRVVPD
jgi:hypothetical protein